jgi:pilus assembly protein CpaB
MLLLLALGCGLVASIGISQVMDARNRGGAPAVEKEPSLVALKDIKVNEPLTEKNLKLEEWPKDKIPADAMRDLKQVLGQRAGGIILADEPLRKAKFAVDHRIEEIPRGYRVVAVSADAVSATGNLLQPGDRVDMVLSVKHNNSSNSNQVAKTILQDIRVFAINDQYRPAEGNKSDESIAAKTVSLLVTPTQAETIALAGEMGKIRLVLRHPDDEGIAETQGAEENELLQGSSKSDRNHETVGESPNRVGGVLDWLKQQSDKSQVLAQASPPPDPEEHFTMDVLKADELTHVGFTRKGKDGRWWNNTTNSAAPGAGGNAANAAAPQAVPVRAPMMPVPTSMPTPIMPLPPTMNPMPTGDTPPSFNLPTDSKMPYGNG